MCWVNLKTKLGNSADIVARFIQLQSADAAYVILIYSVIAEIEKYFQVIHIYLPGKSLRLSYRMHVPYQLKVVHISLRGGKTPLLKWHYMSRYFKPFQNNREITSKYSYLVSKNSLVLFLRHHLTGGSTDLSRSYCVAVATAAAMVWLQLQLVHADALSDNSDIYLTFVCTRRLGF